MKRTESPRASPIELIDGRTDCENIFQSPSIDPSMNLHHRSYPTLEDPDRRRMRRGARRAEYFSRLVDELLHQNRSKIGCIFR